MDNKYYGYNSFTEGEKITEECNQCGNDFEAEDIRKNTTIGTWTLKRIINGGDDQSPLETLIRLIIVFGIFYFIAQSGMIG